MNTTGYVNKALVSVVAVGFMMLLVGGVISSPTTAHAQVSGEKTDSNENGLSGWTIELYNYPFETGSEPVATTVTTEDGSYTVGTELGEQDYLVCEEDRSGWTQTQPTSGDGTAECPNGTTGYVVTGPTASGYNFTNEQNESSGGGGGDVLEPRTEDEPESGTITGTKRDYDTEAGLSGWEISLHEFWSESDGYDTDPEATVTTQADDPDTEANEAGEYQFDDVPPGDYLVCEEARGSWSQTQPATGEDTYECENGTIGHIVTVNSDGSVESGNDFMNREDNGGSIEGVKRDYDTEAGLAGWEITLHNFWSESDGYDETPIRTTTTTEDDPSTETDESGMYSFDNVPFGDYLVCEESRSSWTQTFPTAGEDTYECENGTIGHIVTVSEEVEEAGSNDFMNREDPDYGGGDECARYYDEEGEYDYAEEQYVGEEEGGYTEEEMPEECEDWGEGDEPDGSGDPSGASSSSSPGLPNTGDGTLQ